MTGSILPARAASVMSRVYFSSASYLPSASASVTRWAPRTWLSACSSVSRSRPWDASNFPSSSTFAMASSTCSAEEYSSLSSSVSFQVRVSTSRSRRDSAGSAPPLTFGS